MVIPGQNQRLGAFGDFRLNSVRRNIEFGSPDNGVKNEFTEVGQPPVFEEMPAGESKSAAAIFALDSPADRIIFLLVWRARQKNGLEARVVLAEADAIIELLLYSKWFDASNDRMAGRAKGRISFPRLDRGIPISRRRPRFVI